jgi:putative flippase GtrA
MLLPLKRGALQEFSLFIPVAVTSAGFDMAVFSTLVFFVEIEPIFSQGISRVMGGLTSFGLNKLVTFKNKESKTSVEVRRFLILYSVSYLLSLTLFSLLDRVLLMGVFISKILSDGICFLLNFVAMKLYVYRNTRGLLVRAIEFAKGKD